MTKLKLNQVDVRGEGKVLLKGPILKLSSGSESRRSSLNRFFLRIE